MSGIVILTGVLLLLVAVLAWVARRLWTRSQEEADLWMVSAVVLFVLSGFSSLGVIIAPATYYAAKVGCRNQAQALDVPWRYSLSTSCIVYINGRWFPLDAVRSVNGQLGTGAD